MIFNNRYQETSLEHLCHCSTELITTLDQFYTPVEEMKWYLFKTEDMPNTVEDFVDRKIRKMEKLLATLNIYLDAELGIQGLETNEIDFGSSLQTELESHDSFSVELSDEKTSES
jgi:hypothetical protein